VTVGHASHVTPASNSSWTTARRTPTDRANRPFLTAPARSRTAMVTCSGRSSGSRSADLRTMRGRGMVTMGGTSFGLLTPFLTTTVRRGGGPPSISTNYGTSSLTQHAKLLHVTVHNLLQAVTAHENSRSQADRTD